MFPTKFDKQPQNKKLFTVLQCFVVHLPDWIHIVDILPMCSTNYEANSEYFYISDRGPILTHWKWMILIDKPFMDWVLRMHPPDHQAGVAQVISPISMKLGQFEGFNMKPKNPK